MTEQQSDTPENELEELVTSALDGHASASDVQELETLLISSEENRRAYLDRVGFEDALEGAVKVGVLWSSPVIEPAQNGPHAKVDGTSRSGRRVSVRMLPMALFSTALIALLCVVLSLRQSPDQKYFTPESGGASAGLAVNGVAVVASQADVLWESPIVLSGAVLPRGEHHIQSGVMHLELFSGVQLVIEGEAEFTIDSPMVVKLNKGAVRAYVPDAAHGFQVVTAAGEIIDYGTEFSVHVDGGTTDFTVLDGEIGLLRAEKPELRFSQGESLRVRQAVAQPEKLEVPVRVVSSSAVARAVQDKISSREEAWGVALQEWLRDERLVACYRCSGNSQSRTLENLARGTSQASTAAVVGAAICANRWGHAGQAYDYTRYGSRARVAIPDEMDNLSMVCWVRINSLSNLFNSLFLTDGHDEGKPHWQIQKDGRIFFSVKHPHRKGTSWRQTVFYSPDIWRDEMSGEWNMLAVTYDRRRGQVAHYLNGNQVSMETIPEHATVPLVHIGSASIANWADPMYRTDEEFTCRNLNGAIDEFLIFDGALTASDVARLYAESTVGE
jgi:ferric-dicitrate binding protein FerR (iron transport regulator)